MKRVGAPPHDGGIFVGEMIHLDCNGLEQGSLFNTRDVCIIPMAMG